MHGSRAEGVDFLNTVRAENAFLRLGVEAQDAHEPSARTELRPTRSFVL